MDQAQQIIDELGGTMKAAEMLGLPPTTVSSWKNAKAGIPRWWHDRVNAAFADAGKVPPFQSSAAA